MIIWLLGSEGARSSSFQALQNRPEIKDRDIAKSVLKSLPNGQSALHIAAYWGLIQLTISLLERIDFNIIVRISSSARQHRRP